MEWQLRLDKQTTAAYLAMADTSDQRAQRSARAAARRGSSSDGVDSAEEENRSGASSKSDEDIGEDDKANVVENPEEPAADVEMQIDSPEDVSWLPSPELLTARATWVDGAWEPVVCERLTRNPEVSLDDPESVSVDWLAPPRRAASAA